MTTHGTETDKEDVDENKRRPGYPSEDVACPCWLLVVKYYHSSILAMPVTHFKTPERYKYLNGFGSFHEYVLRSNLTCGYKLSNAIRSEALEGALPIGANSPQKPPYGLYASAAHEPFRPYPDNANVHLITQLDYVPNQFRWDPFDMNPEADWIHGLKHLAGAGDMTVKTGLGIYVFAAGRDMDQGTAMYSSDGDMLIVAQHGTLDIQTELGSLLVRPNEIVVIPRGIRYRVTLPEGPVRGYILELYQGHFVLPELGPIGSNCLANARDFQIPLARFDEDTSSTWSVINKYNGKLYVAKQNHTPFDVVAWHGR
jgi:homogentisate 1,2-dioxygenase